MNSVHFSSEKHDWTTPRDFFNKLDAEFNFSLDAAATNENALCSDYFTEEDDGLAQDWTGTVWVNPPYGRQIGAWIRKAHAESLKGATVVMLIPARVDTAAWHDVIFPHAEVRFVRGRLKFGAATESAPFPSAVVVFRPRTA